MVTTKWKIKKGKIHSDRNCKKPALQVDSNEVR